MSVEPLHTSCGILVMKRFQPRSSRCSLDGLSFLSLFCLYSLLRLLAISSDNFSPTSLTGILPEAPRKTLRSIVSFLRNNFNKFITSLFSISRRLIPYFRRERKYAFNSAIFVNDFMVNYPRSRISRSPFFRKLNSPDAFWSLTLNDVISKNTKALLIRLYTT